MNFLSTIKDLIYPNSGMICPRCEKALEGHDQAACERRMPGRYFFGVAAGAAALSVSAVAPLPTGPAYLVSPAFTTEFVKTGRGLFNPTLSYEELRERILAPAMRALAQDVDRMWMASYDRAFANRLQP